jgi:cell division transport system ATP-binding protein
VIQFHNVSKTYKNGTKALQGVNLTIEDGEFVFIVGSSGAGKSTLMKMILMEETPTEGQIEVNGYNLGKLKRRDIPFFRRTLGVVFQDFRLIPTMSVYDNVAFALRVTNVSTKDIRRRVPYILGLVGLQSKARSMPEQLSGGEQQRVALARALVNNPSLIIADATSTRNSLMRLWTSSTRSTNAAPPSSWSPMSTIWCPSSTTGS